MKNEEIYKALLDAGWSEAVARQDIANCHGDPAKLQALKAFAAENGGSWEAASSPKEKKASTKGTFQRRYKAPRKVVPQSNSQMDSEIKNKTPVSDGSPAKSTRRPRSDRPKAPPKRQEKRKVKFEEKPDDASGANKSNVSEQPVLPPVPVHPASHKWVGMAKRLASQTVTNVVLPQNQEAHMADALAEELPEMHIKSPQWPRRKVSVEDVEAVVQSKEVDQAELEASDVVTPQVSVGPACIDEAVEEQEAEVNQTVTETQNEEMLNQAQPSESAKTEDGSKLVSSEGEVDASTDVEEAAAGRMPRIDEKETTVRSPDTSMGHTSGVSATIAHQEARSPQAPNITLPPSVNHTARYAQQPWGGYVHPHLGYGWPYANVNGVYSGAHPVAPGASQQTWGYPPQYYSRPGGAYWHPQASKHAVNDNASPSMFVPYVPPSYVYHQSMPPVGGVMPATAPTTLPSSAPVTYSSSEQ